MLARLRATAAESAVAEAAPSEAVCEAASSLPEVELAVSEASEEPEPVLLADSVALEAEETVLLAESSVGSLVPHSMARQASWASLSLGLLATHWSLYLRQTKLGRVCS